MAHCSVGLTETNDFNPENIAFPFFLVLLLSWVWITISGLPPFNDLGQPGFTYMCDMILLYQCHI